MGLVTRPEPVIPDYAGPWIGGIVPALLAGRPAARPGWISSRLGPESDDEGPVVLFVLDGLGWNQFDCRRDIAPNLASLRGSFIRTVAPSTTATALTSIATGATPVEHGVLGYRMHMGGATVMNTLRWGDQGRDFTRKYPPETVQPVVPFCGFSPPVVSKVDFVGSAFTSSHMRGVRHHPYRVVSTLVSEVVALVAAGESFVYCYWDGIDTTAHEHGFGEQYDEALRLADHLVGRLLERLPVGTTLLVTADHGQVETADREIHPDADLLRLVDFQSGEGRVRWLHARAGRAADLERECHARWSDVAWVMGVDETLDRGVFGPVGSQRVRDAARRRLGDVALVPFAPTTFHDPMDSGPFRLVCRHGSLTADEMLVPFLSSAR
ncbi:MAG: alkaline phosphatase family protein [Ilumatobacteraceae bacterium]